MPDVSRQLIDFAKLQAVLFDMDGTLVASDAAVERAWRTWSGEYGVDPEVVLSIAQGRPAASTVRDLRPDLGNDGVAKAAARQLALEYDDLSDVVAVAGALELLVVLDAHGLPWAVVTSADRRLAGARLAAAKIPPPGALVTSEDVVRGKPDPEGYLLAAKLLGVGPARCLVVEDALPGAQAGAAAGAAVATLKGAPSDLQLEDLGQLMELLVERLGPSPQ